MTMKQGLTNTKRYGIVSRSDLNIGSGGVGANMQSRSLRTPMHHVGYIRSASPGMVRAGEAHYGSMIPSALEFNRKITGALQRRQERRDADENEEQSGSAEPAGAVGPASSYYSPPPGGMGLRRPEPAKPYIAPAGGMGAVVPASRLKKFAQGRGGSPGPG